MRGPEHIIADEAQPADLGHNTCFILTDSVHRKLVFKSNTGGRYRLFTTAAECRRRNLNNIMASRILANFFSIDTILYRDAVLCQPGGERRGVVCDYVESLRFFHELDAATIENRIEATVVLMALIWFGDIDRIENPGNECVTADNRYVALDFDFCFFGPPSFLGIPCTSRRAFLKLTTSDGLRDVWARIERITDTDIAQMVEAIGKEWISDWSEDDHKFYVRILIDNRDRLENTNLFDAFSPTNSWIKRIWEAFVTRHVFTLNIPFKIVRLVLTQGIRATASTAVHRALTGLS